MTKTIVFTCLPGILILIFSYLGYILKNDQRIIEEWVRKKKGLLRRTDEMVFGQYWIVFSLINLFLLSRLCDEEKWHIPYISSTDYVTYFFSISLVGLCIAWLFSIFFLKALAARREKLYKRHTVNLLGLFSIFALSWALAGL
jgi:hypothetical protein